MIKVLSTNIISPLGMTAQENWEAVLSGKSSMRRLEHWRNIPEAFVASAFTDEQIEALAVEGYSRFESMVLRSVEDAVSRSGINAGDGRTLFVLSTTKADVEQLPSNGESWGNYHRPAEVAERIAARLGIGASDVIVCCNACISGISAQVLADRLISAGKYDNAVVCGADCVTAFCAAGFLSFKSLSPEPCRPFDIDRLGLNLGDGAATIVFTKDDSPLEGRWHFVDSCLDNDAYHLSAPSPTGSGALKALQRVMDGRDKDGLAFVNAHGTATMFNDQMESVAIQKAGLSDVPLTALKGWYGHTFGASGVIEAVISMMAVENGVVLPVKGFSEIGVSGKINISSELRHTDKRSFLKMISGFGGCNGAALYSMDEPGNSSRAVSGKSVNAYGNAMLDELQCSHSVKLTDSSLEIDGVSQSVSEHGKSLLTEIYRGHIGDYPKYFKMDLLSRLVFLASEILLRLEGEDSDKERAIVLFNRTSSIVSDRSHIASYSGDGNFFPSPSVFLYTLPNIVTGEIAIRHGYTGETSLYILEGKNREMMENVVRSTFSATGDLRSMLCGWVDCSDEDSFEANLYLINKM